VVALQWLEQSDKTKAEKHCPCFIASQSCGDAALFVSLPASPTVQTNDRSPAITCQYT